MSTLVAVPDRWRLSRYLSARSGSRTTGGRGQTEPLPALVAIAVVCLAVSTYAAVVAGLVPDLGSDRELAEVTSDRIWAEVSENGVYPGDTDLEDDISVGTLPRGQRVYSNVTYVGEDGHVVEQSRAGFDETGALTVATPPPAGDVYERPIAVKHRNGDVRPGTLTVIVWDSGREGDGR